MKTKQCEPTPPSPAIAGLTPYKTNPPAKNIRLKLDSNEGQTPAFDLSRLVTCDFGKYPDYAELQNQIATRFGLDDSQVLISAGGDEAIDRICRAFLKPGRNIVFPTPSFEMIRKYALMTGADVRCVDWLDGFPVDHVLSVADEETAIVAIVSPNNPTGATISLEQVQQLSDALPNCILLVDQAYAEFEESNEESLTAFALQNIPNAIVVRTFSKAWGLASLRVGYALGNSELIQTLRCVGNPFPVSGLSAHVATIALQENTNSTQSLVKAVKKERDSLVELFKRFGVSIEPSQGNFVYIELENLTLSASLVYNALRAQGILVRLFSDANAIRITCPGNEEDFDYLQQCLTSIFAPEAIIFDMDGVLVDEAPSYREAIRLTCNYYGQTFSAEEIARLKLSGNTNNDWLFTQQLLQSRGVEIDLATVKERFEAIYQGTPQEPGIWDREVCLVNADWLREIANNYKLAIVTGRPTGDAFRFLDSQGIKDCFSAIICMEDGPAKPDPSNVNKALNNLGVRSAWMIGDTQDDAMAAIAAGVVAFGIVAPNDDKEFSSNQLFSAGVCTIVDSLEEFGDVTP